MAPKNCYLVLGISTRETPAGIRARYRDLARRHHPDLAGAEGADRFREVAEAYEILSDPASRREHDRRLGVAPPRAAGRGHRVAERFRPARRVEAEPLVPEVSIRSDPDSVRPSFDGLIERFRRNFTGARVPKSERLEGLNLVLPLSREELVRGGVVPVAIPVYHRCPACAGTGRDWAGRCLACDGDGVLAGEQRVEIEIPPGCPPSIVELPLDRLGIRNLILRLHLRMIG